MVGFRLNYIDFDSTLRIQDDTTGPPLSSRFDATITYELESSFVFVVGLEREREWIIYFVEIAYFEYVYIYFYELYTSWKYYEYFGRKISSVCTSNINKRVKRCNDCGVIFKEILIMENVL